MLHGLCATLSWVLGIRVISGLGGGTLFPGLLRREDLQSGSAYTRQKSVSKGGLRNLKKGALSCRAAYFGPVVPLKGKQIWSKGRENGLLMPSRKVHG